MSWRARAICRDEDPELFFPVGSRGPALAQLAAAKEVCSRCPVQPECLRWAMDQGELDGVWGGTSEDERSAGVASGWAGPGGAVRGPARVDRPERPDPGRG